MNPMTKFVEDQQQAVLNAIDMVEEQMPNVKESALNFAAYHCERISQETLTLSELISRAKIVEKYLLGQK